MRLRITSLLGLLVVLASIMPTPVHAQEFKVVVNSGNTVESMSTDELTKIFLKQATSFPTGASASPIDLSKDAPARVAFSKKVLGRSVNAVETYWQQQIFSGKDVPPLSKANPDDVVAFVRANPGGIGYVTPGTATPGVKVIAVR